MVSGSKTQQEHEYSAVVYLGAIMIKYARTCCSVCVWKYESYFLLDIFQTSHHASTTRHKRWLVSGGKRSDWRLCVSCTNKLHLKVNCTWIKFGSGMANNLPKYIQGELEILVWYYSMKFIQVGSHNRPTLLLLSPCAWQ